MPTEDENKKQAPAVAIWAQNCSQYQNGDVFRSMILSNQSKKKSNQFEGW